MKNSKIRRTLILLASVLLVIGLSVSATLAYLTSTTAVVTNTFTVGKVAITLDEAKVDAYGVADSSAARVTENTYKLIPGHTYAKDPTIHVDAESEQSYVFVKIANGIAAIESADATIASQMTAYNWVPVTGAEGIYCKCDASGNPMVVAAGTDVKVFDTFTVNADLGTELSAYADQKVEITAYAIQADGFDGKTAADIWAALNK